MNNFGTQVSSHGLDNHGLSNVNAAYWNLSAPRLYAESLNRGEGLLAQGCASPIQMTLHRTPPFRALGVDAGLWVLVRLTIPNMA